MSTPRNPRLSDLIQAAAPPRVQHDPNVEFRGEAEAVGAFREARLNPAFKPRRHSMSAGKLLVIKAAAAATVALSGGGVALAAATGHMPAQLGGHPSTDATHSAADSSHGKNGAHAASPSPSMQGLCHAFTNANGVQSNPGKALENPAFTALINAAGGKANVSSYCAKVLASASGKSGNAGSNAGGNSGSNGQPASHPTGKPTAMPSQASGNSGGADSGSGTPAAQATAHPTSKASLHPAP